MKWVIASESGLHELQPGGPAPNRKVLLSPELGSARHLALGLSVYAPASRAETHEHDAEEVGYVIRGGGIQMVEDIREELAPGSVTHVAPGLPHSTEAGPDGLAVVWVYAPAGSEKRWMQPRE